MIRDYSVYVLSGKEKIIFYIGGYICIFTVVFLFYRSLLLSVPAGFAVHLLRPHWEKRKAAARMNRLQQQFRDMLYSLSASIAAGSQMDEAITEAEENLAVLYSSSDLIMKELQYMRVNIRENKESDKLLLKDFAFRSKSEDINNFVQVYITCRSMGGNMEKVIEHTTEILTDKMTIEREIKTVTAQKKLEGRIISVMPLLMLILMNIGSLSYITPLYTTLAGRIIMTGALAATLYGVYLMEKLSEIDV